MRRGSWVVIGLLLGCLTHADYAAAQLYQWRDTNGKMVFSDTPPPPNTPPGNIIKSPRGRSAPAPAPAAPAEGAAKDAGGAPATAAASGPKTLAERDADYKKRQADAAEKAKKDQEAATAAKDKEDMCKGLRSNLASLESGQRIRRENDKGERVFIDDDQRAREIEDARRKLSKCGA